MAKVKVLARNWLIEVNTGTVALPAWTKVGGINSFTVSGDKEDTDTTDFDSGGWGEHIVASRSRSISFEGFFLEDQADGSRDAGQAFIEDASEEIGPDSISQTRITSPAGKVTEYSGSYSTGDVGGGINDATSWGAEMTVSGKPVKVTP